MAGIEESFPQEPLIDPLKFHDYFGVRKLVKIEELFNARVHLGHKEGTLNPKMVPFTYGTRLGHLIIDLNQTAELLSDALNFMAHIAYRDGIILFVNHYPQHTMLIEETARKCGEFAFAREWRINMFTNATNIYGGVTRLPDLCILLSTLDPMMRDHLAILDCAKMGIPSIGIVDTNSDPNLITYPIPGNDDSPSSVNLYCKLFVEAILAGKAKRKEQGLS
nr:EOG090X0B5N [Artemia franciscana]